MANPRFQDLPPSVQAAIQQAERRQAPAERGEAGSGIAAIQRQRVVALKLDRLAKLNRTERAYAELLAIRKAAGEIADFRVQAMTFLLGEDCRYTPDFTVVECDGTMTQVDVKGGHTWEDSVIKLKTAADKFPWFRWQMVERRESGWVTVRSLPKE